jgi:hypothetical protein
MSARRSDTLHYSEKVVWTAVLIGIPAWIAHLVFEAAMVDFTGAHPGWEWTLHAATALTALPTLAGIAICFDLYRRTGPARPPAPDDDAGEASPVALSRFLGALGMFVGVTNLALILLEGSYVILVKRGG